MGTPWRFESGWHTEDLFKDYFTQTEVNTLISSNYGLLPIYASAPTAWEGRMYVNSGDDKIYIYYGGAWQALHTLTSLAPPVITDGTPMGLLLALTYQT